MITPPIAPGYVEQLWQRMWARGKLYTCRAGEPGPHGECWANVHAAVAAHPGWHYAEGVVSHPRGRYGPGWIIRPRMLYPHAWAVDEFGDGIEVTEGWTALCATAEYRGLILPDALVRRAQAYLNIGEPSVSALELSLTAEPTTQGAPHGSHVPGADRRRARPPRRRRR